MNSSYCADGKIFLLDTGKKSSEQFVQLYFKIFNVFHSNKTIIKAIIILLKLNFVCKSVILQITLVSLTLYILEIGVDGLYCKLQ